MTKEGLNKALEPLFNLARDNPDIKIRFHKSFLDTIDRLEEDQDSLLKEK